MSRSTAAQQFRRLVPLLKLASKVVERIPTPQDTWPQKIAKVLALLDATNEIYGGGRSKMRELTDRYGLVERESETFVRLFFATTLRDLFTLRRQQLDEREDLIEAVSADGQRLFFRETHYGNARIESDFWVTDGLDFATIIDRLWEQYPNGIYLSITSEAGGWRKETTICEAPPAHAERLSREARSRLDGAVARHMNFVADGVQRTYLLLGPIGTGKTTFSTLFPRAFGGRALKLDATSLAIISVKEIGFLLDTLRPGFLVIDDVDRAPIAEVAPRVLFILERLKTHYPNLTILMSVNDATKLDSAFLRCGRIDIPIEFPAPERDEVEQLVRDLFVAHRVPAARATTEVVDRIVDDALKEHLTHAYLDDLCRRLRHEELDDVLASVNLLRRLAEKAAKADGAGEPGSNQPAKDASAPPLN